MFAEILTKSLANGQVWLPGRGRIASITRLQAGSPSGTEEAGSYVLGIVRSSEALLRPNYYETPWKRRYDQLRAVQDTGGARLPGNTDFAGW